MINKLANGKYEVRWPVASVKVNGVTLTGRPDTLRAITGAALDNVSEVRMIGTLDECERQL